MNFTQRLLSLSLLGALSPDVYADGWPEAWPTAKADSYPLRLPSSDSFGLLGNVLLNDDGVGLRVTSVNEYSSNGGMVKINDDQQSLSYKSLKPASEWPYTDTFWYVLTDNWGRTNSAKVTLTVDYSAPPEAWPQANLDSESTFVNTPVVVNVLANDVGEGLSLKSVNESSTKWGSVVINGDKLVYTPRYNYTGSDEFWYVFEDAWGRTNSSKVTVDVSRNLSVARIPLNDTGLTTCGDYTGKQFSHEANHNNALGDCTAATDSDGDNIPTGQDATLGRDATSPDYSDGEAGFSFTKLDASGNHLPATAASWSCVKDNHTGLIWESKQGLGRGTGSAGLHSADDKYFWYSTDPSINGGIEQVTVGSTFRPADDAVAIDKRTNLVWQRCPLGQVWNKTTSQCDFSVMAKNWKDALESAPEGWRLPNLKELASLAEYRCSGPALNITVFPNLGNWSYWTSTVMKRLDLSGPTFNSPGGTIANDFSNYAWSISTYNGVNLSGYKTEAKAVRYVKDYQPESK